MDLPAIQVYETRLLEQLASGDQTAWLKTCEDFELEHCGNADPARMLPFYRVQLISYLLEDLVNARWLWERLPASLRMDPELNATWKIAQHLWKHEMANAFHVIMDTPWTEPLSALARNLLEGLRARNMKLIASSHSCIAVQDLAVMLGMPELEAVKRCLEKGWKEEKGFLKPVMAADDGGLILGKEQLQQLTDYVCKLDTR